jgi:DNA-binding CsgD family transcriptional regulator/tetratricopeptide (TPR) repeat protein
MTDSTDAVRPTADFQVELAAGRWASAEAVLTAALVDGEDPDARFARGIAVWWQDRTLEAMRDWETAYVAFRRRGARESAVVAAVYLALSASMTLGNRSVARGWAARADRLAGEGDLAAVRGLVALARAHITIDDGQPEAGLRIASETLEAMRGSADADPDIELCLMSEAGMALVELGRAAEGIPLLDEAMAGAMSGEAREPDSVVLISCRSVTASNRSGDVRRALDWIRQADAFHAQFGSAHLYTTCRLEYGDLLFATGDWGRAADELETARRVGDRIEPALVAAASGTLAELRLAQGRLEEAARLLAGLDDQPVALKSIALVRLRTGEPRPAATLLRRRLRDVADGTLLAARLQELLGEAVIESGGADEALDLGEQLFKHGTRASTAAITIRAHRLLGRALLATGATGEAAERLELAIAGFAGLGLPYETADSRRLLARAMADVDRETAVAEARAAFAAFDDLGAMRDVDATAALLRSLGVRAAPRSARASGTLTHREREVLVLLGEGLSNPEISDRLFITRKTVEHHVANVLAKLGLNGRSEAAAFAVRAGMEDTPGK